jgi:hypothetical protein
VSNLLIELEGPDRARARSYFLAVTDRGTDHWGRYRDDLLRTNDGWRFAHRRVRTDGAGPGSWVESRGRPPPPPPTGAPRPTYTQFSGSRRNHDGCHSAENPTSPAAVVPQLHSASNYHRGRKLRDRAKSGESVDLGLPSLP